MVTSSSAKNGFVVVADITGYTSYLSHSELEHAQDVLKDLLGVLVDHTQPPLVISRLAGDAVLSYSVDSERFEGQSFVEMIEGTYVAFKRAIDLMVLNTSCDCNACANISALDLKFFVHHGEFVVQDIDDHDELVGTDVNLIFRLMKNEVVERTGVRAYTLYTEAAVERLGLPGFTEGLTLYEDEVADLGAVSAWIADMGPVWERGRVAMATTLDPSEVFVTVGRQYPLPPPIMWGYLTNPESRAVVSSARLQKVHQRSNGRLGDGSVYECFHGGGKTSTNTIVEWRPFTAVVTENTGFGNTRFLSVVELEPGGEGSVVTVTWGRLIGPTLSKVFMKVFYGRGVESHITKGLDALGGLIEGDRQAGRVEVPDRHEIETDEIESAAWSALGS